jgi:hypothetical protein
MLSGSTQSVESNAVLGLLFQDNPDILTDHAPLREAKAKYNGKSIFVIRKHITIDGITGDNLKLGTRK